MKNLNGHAPVELVQQEHVFRNGNWRSLQLGDVCCFECEKPFEEIMRKGRLLALASNKQARLRSVDPLCKDFFRTPKTTLSSLAA